MTKCYACLICLCLLSCVFEEHDTPEHKRTVFVYIGRDNSLGGSSEEKIESLMNGWDGRNGYLVIYQDLSSGSTLQEIYVEKGVKKTRIIEEREDEDSASPAVFTGILSRVVNMYPADSYGLILFSHASGWLPDATLSSPRVMPRSLVQDGNNWMSLSGFASAIPDRRFDFIIFEACFMAGIEVAYELRNKTDYIVASSAEILSPGFKNIYETSVNELFKPEADLTAFTRNAYDAVNAQSGDLRSATLSVIRTEGLNALSTWLRDNSSANISVEIRDIQHFDRGSNHLFFDFEDYFSRVITNSGQRNELTRLINNCVVYQAATKEFMPTYQGFEIKKHSGLTTYISQDEFPYLNERYQELSWFKKINNY